MAILTQREYLVSKSGSAKIRHLVAEGVELERDLGVDAQAEVVVHDLAFHLVVGGKHDFPSRVDQCDPGTRGKTTTKPISRDQKRKADNASQEVVVCVSIAVLCCLLRQ